MGKSNIIEIKEKIESYLRAGNLKKASKEIKSAFTGRRTGHLCRVQERTGLLLHGSLL
ncbi:MAG: hypothetical protein ACTSSI_10745 [Candidatus Helarchaeota archaeon]